MSGFFCAKQKLGLFRKARRLHLRARQRQALVRKPSVDDRVKGVHRRAEFEIRKRKRTTRVADIAGDTPDLPPAGSAPFAKKVEKFTEAPSRREERRKAREALRMPVAKILPRPGARAGRDRRHALMPAIHVALRAGVRRCARSRKHRILLPGDIAGARRFRPSGRGGCAAGGHPAAAGCSGFFPPVVFSRFFLKNLIDSLRGWRLYTAHQRGRHRRWRRTCLPLRSSQRAAIATLNSA